jgi:hypothetical protein
MEILITIVFFAILAVLSYHAERLMSDPEDSIASRAIMMVAAFMLVTASIALIIIIVKMLFMIASKIAVYL